MVARWPGAHSVACCVRPKCRLVTLLMLVALRVGQSTSATEDVDDSSASCSESSPAATRRGSAMLQRPTTVVRLASERLDHNHLSSKPASPNAGIAAGVDEEVQKEPLQLLAEVRRKLGPAWTSLLFGLLVLMAMLLAAVTAYRRLIPAAQQKVTSHRDPGSRKDDSKVERGDSTKAYDLQNLSDVGKIPEVAGGDSGEQSDSTDSTWDISGDFVPGTENIAADSGELCGEVELRYEQSEAITGSERHFESSNGQKEVRELHVESLQACGPDSGVEQRQTYGGYEKDLIKKICEAAPYGQHMSTVVEIISEPIEEPSCKADTLCGMD